MVAERDDDFEMKISVKEWQVMEETKSGISLEMEFGIRNKATILIPAHTEKNNIFLNFNYPRPFGWGFLFVKKYFKKIKKVDKNT